jgi:hypothetical protein
MNAWTSATSAARLSADGGSANLPAGLGYRYFVAAVENLSKELTAARNEWPDGNAADI